MRILYHHRTSAQDGSAVHIEGLISGLRQLGTEVVIVAPPIASQTVGAPGRRAWVREARRRLPRAVHEFAECAYNAPEAMALLRAVRDYKPDLIYQRSNLYLLSGAWVAKRSGIPLIEEVNAPYFRERSRHGGIALPSLAAWTERTAWRRADAVITVTQVLADIVAEQGVPAERLHVMPNGIDESLLRPDAVDREAKSRLGLAGYTVLGFTGFVRDWNGLDVVIDLLAQPEGANWFLLVVGDGPARASLEGRARELGVGARVRFTGVVKRVEVPSLVSAFDVALQPAANPYASPLKLFEYMALGRAIVAPDQPNIREVLTPDHDAMLFNPHDAGALESALKVLAAQPDRRERLSRAALDTLRRRNLTWHRNADQVLALAARLRSAGQAPA